MIEIFKYRNKVALAKTPVDMLEADYMQLFITMTSEIGERDYLDDVPITFVFLASTRSRF